MTLKKLFQTLSLLTAVAVLSCADAQKPFLSTLEADKDYPLYTTYAAALERSNFTLDQGYEFRYYIDSLGADFITDTGGDLALGFKLGDRWVYRIEDMYQAPTVTSSYPDMVKYVYYPFEGIKVEAWFVVHSSTQALLDVKVRNGLDTEVELEVYPFMRNRTRSFQRVTQDGNHFIFEHQEYPDAWTLNHELPYTDSIRNVLMVSETPAECAVFTSEQGETFRIPNDIELDKKALLQVNGRVYLPGKQRISETGGGLRLQLFVDGNHDELLTDNSPVWGGTHPAIDQGGFYRLEAGMLNQAARSYTIYAYHEASGLFGQTGGTLMSGNKRHDVDLVADIGIPTVTGVHLKQGDQHTISIHWDGNLQHRSYSVYRRQYPSPLYVRVAKGVTDTTYTDRDFLEAHEYGYLVVPVDKNNQLGMHAPEVNTIQQTVFKDFVERGRAERPANSQPHAKIITFRNRLHLKKGATQSLRIVRAVSPIAEKEETLIQSATDLLNTPLERYQQDNEKFFSKTPIPDFENPEKVALYWSANNMMRQVFYPPEGKSGYNYYVFSREPTWGWGHGGQVFHESIAMLAYAYLDPQGAMNSQRVYRERQYPNGYINYRTGSYLDEIIEHNGQLTTSAPWYAWLNWEIYKVTGDKAFLDEMYASSQKLFRFIVDNRDSDGDGLCEWGGHAVLESVRDALVAVWDEVGYPANFESLDLNCMLVKEAKSLEQMALELGLDEEAEKWRADYERRTQLINETFWDEENGFYYNVDKTTHLFTHKTENDLKRDEIIGFLPLWAGVANAERAEKLIHKLTDPAYFWRAHGVPTLSAKDSYYNAKGYWNGPVWVQWNYLIMLGLVDYGYHGIAQELVDRVASGMITVLKDNHNLWEFYSPDEPWGGYHKTYIWAGIINRMMMDMAELR